jgi:hypothetical protein
MYQKSALHIVFSVKQLFYIVLIFVLAATPLKHYSQLQPQGNTKHTEAAYITHSDSIWLSQLPEISLPDHFKTIVLPSEIDNSVWPYFPPVILQTGPSCGQAAGIAYNFTYEMCRKRNLTAMDSSNRFPTHFAYNFMSYQGWYGVNYMHSFEIARRLGMPTVADYGGLAIDDGLIWLSGYDTYHKAMKNRLQTVYRIDVGTPEGLNTLKHWLVHRLEGHQYGGVANFNASSPWSLQNLPAGTPEAGKKVVIEFPGHVATHAMTIVGFNDSIRFDYNGDGQYTNHLDINNDGMVDMRDWEIGALKYANSYGDDWANEGFAYLMYKTLAEDVYDGGIWNHMVHVIDVHQTYEPLLTIKLKLKHNSREQIRIVAGVSCDTISNLPQHRLYFPAFNFQGGPNFMQGYNTDEAFKYIEIGLDISPLLSYIETGQAADFYLEVYENDPLNVGNGKIVHYAIRDYNNDEVIEIDYPQQDIPLNHNEVTILRIRHQLDFDKVQITSDEIPPFDAGYQLEATGGSEPYHWDLITPYYQQFIEADFPLIEQQQVELEGPNFRYGRQHIEFDFPFYGETYNELFVHKDGFLLFSPDIFPWPYYNDTYILFKAMRNISAFLFKPIKYYEGKSADEGIWYDGDETKAAFLWKQPMLYGDETIGYAEFALVLYPDGNIEFYYKGIDEDEPILWYAGVSAGDNTAHQLIHGSNTSFKPGQKSYRLVPEPVPDGISISEDGFLMGISDELDRISNLTFRVKDDQYSSHQKVLQLSDKLRFDYTLTESSGRSLHNGSQVQMDLQIHNISTESVEGLVASLSTEDPYLQIDNGEVFVGHLGANASVSLPAFSFTVSNECPDRHNLLIDLQFDFEGGSKTGLVWESVMAPQMIFSKWMVDDGDNYQLDQGETAPLMVQLRNLGSIVGYDVRAALSTEDPFVTINQVDTLSFGDILQGQTGEAFFEVSVAAECPMEHEVEFVLSFTDDSHYMQQQHFAARVGQYPFLLLSKAKNDNSVREFRTVLDSLNLDYVQVDSLPEEMDLYRAAIVCLGTYYSNTSLSQAEGAVLAEFLDRGGRLYMEGTQTWHTDQPTPVHGKFRISTQNALPPVEFSSLRAVDGGFAAGLNFEFVGEYPILFWKLVPLDAAVQVLRADESAEDFMMISYTGGLYKTVGSMFEFGSFGSEADFELRKEFVLRLLRFFDMEHLLYIDVAEHIMDAHFIKARSVPNPFKTEVILSAKWPNQELVHLRIMNQMGELCWQPAAQLPNAEGHIEFLWNGQNNERTKLPAGIYMAQFVSFSKTITIRLVKQH